MREEDWGRGQVKKLLACLTDTEKAVLACMVQMAESCREAPQARWDLEDGSYGRTGAELCRELEARIDQLMNEADRRRRRAESGPGGG